MEPCGSDTVAGAMDKRNVATGAGSCIWRLCLRSAVARGDPDRASVWRERIHKNAGGGDGKVVEAAETWSQAENNGRIRPDEFRNCVACPRISYLPYLC